MARKTSVPSKKSKGPKKKTKIKKGKAKTKKPKKISERKQNATKKKPRKSSQTHFHVNNFFLEKGIIVNTTNSAGINPEQQPETTTPADSAEAINQRQEGEIQQLTLCMTQIAEEQGHSQRTSRTLISKMDELTKKLEEHLSSSQDRRSKEAEEKAATTAALEKLKSVLEKNKQRREKINEKLNPPAPATPAT
jgi:hypothetical protein